MDGRIPRKLMESESDFLRRLNEELALISREYPRGYVGCDLAEVRCVVGQRIMQIEHAKEAA